MEQGPRILGSIRPNIGNSPGKKGGVFGGRSMTRKQKTIRGYEKGCNLHQLGDGDSTKVPFDNHCISPNASALSTSSTSSPSKKLVAMVEDEAKWGLLKGRMSERRLSPMSLGESLSDLLDIAVIADDER